MPRLPRHPYIWLAAFLLWFGVLWTLSASDPVGPETPPLPHFDKIAHFGYFFGGGGLLSAYLFRRNPLQPNWRHITLTTLFVIAVVGAIDEFHQSFTPTRSGNDPLDWLADVLGASAGTLVFRRCHRLLT